MSDYTRTFNGEAKAKLTQLFNEGTQVLHEIETLSEGLNDTIKAIAEELEIKPATLKKAIKISASLHSLGWFLVCIVSSM